MLYAPPDTDIGLAALIPLTVIALLVCTLPNAAPVTGAKLNPSGVVSVPTSSFRIVTMPWPRSIVAPTGALRLTKKVSSSSTSVSPFTLND